MKDATREARLLAKVIVDGESGCWQWLGTLTKQGYGQLICDYRKVVAHRWFYERFVGPIPDGLELDHLCRNRSCVNPRHLEPVTTKVNVLRGEGITAHNSRKTHCKHGHEFTEANTYRRPDGDRACRSCGLEAVLRYQRKQRSS